MRIRSRQGFSLIELMIVIVIIGILVAVVVPNLFRMTLRAKISQVKRNMHVVQVTAEDYSSRNNGHYPASALAVTSEGGLRFDEVLPGGNMPENPFTAAPTVLDWSNVLGTTPSTDLAGGVALNVASTAVAGAWDSYDILGDDERGLALSLVLRNN